MATRVPSDGPTRSLLGAAICVAMLLPAVTTPVRAQEVVCATKDKLFVGNLKQPFEQYKSGEQQRAASSIVDLVNACGGKDGFLDDLFAQAEQAKDPQAVFTLASIVNVAKTPWKLETEAKQDEWLKKFYAAYQAATDDASRAVLNGAVMNADGLYRQAAARIQAARPGTKELEIARSGLQNTLNYPASPNYDDAKFLLAELKLREIIAVRTRAMAAPSPDNNLAEARGLLTELVQAPKSNPPRYIMYGYWNLALLDLLAGNKEQAGKHLESMNTVYNDSLNVPSKLTWNHTLYYYRAFHYSEFGVINNHITAGELYTRWKAASAAWPADASFTGADGPARLAAEMEKVFKDTSTYFVSVGVFSTRDAAQKRRDEMVKSGMMSDNLVVYPPWPERNVYTVGTGLMTLANARKFLATDGGKLPKGSPITRFY
jgi:hypothetical protein